MRKASLQSKILCKTCSWARYIETEGKCPITGEELDLSDLIDVKSEFLGDLSSSLAQPLVKPKPTPATSIPGLLVSLQNEWDSMMLESFTLKKHLQAVRQELSQASETKRALLLQSTCIVWFIYHFSVESAAVSVPEGPKMEVEVRTIGFC